MAGSDENHGRSRRPAAADRGCSHRSDTRWPDDKEIGWHYVRFAPCTRRRGAWVSWLSLKTKVYGLSVVWRQNRWYGFLSGLTSKPLERFEGPKKATRWGEWELIKKFWGNLAYIPKLTQHVPLLTRPRPHSYRKAISPRNWFRKSWITAKALIDTSQITSIDSTTKIKPKEQPRVSDPWSRNHFDSTTRMRKTQAFNPMAQEHNRLRRTNFLTKTETKSTNGNQNQAEN
jgi:hypothetical protein